MSIEDSILTLAHSIGRLADAISTTGTTATTTTCAVATAKAEKPEKPAKAEKATKVTEVIAAPEQLPLELPIATAAEVVADAAAKVEAEAEETFTYDSTRALLMQIAERDGREAVVKMLADAGINDLKKAEPQHLKYLTRAAQARGAK
jgi:hypothetical protein